MMYPGSFMNIFYTVRVYGPDNVYYMQLSQGKTMCQKQKMHRVVLPCLVFELFPHDYIPYS